MSIGEITFNTCFDCGANTYSKTDTRCHKCQPTFTAKRVAENERDASIAKLVKLDTDKKVLTDIVKFRWRKVTVIWFALWITLGSSYAIYLRSTETKGCVYRSLASLINPGFVIGCELFRERFEIGK